MELFWQQKPRGQSLNLPVKVGDGELPGLVKARCAVRQHQLFASEQGPHTCQGRWFLFQEGGWWGAQMPIPAELTPTLRSPKQGFAG